MKKWIEISNSTKERRLNKAIHILEGTCSSGSTLNYIKKLLKEDHLKLENQILEDAKSSILQLNKRRGYEYDCPLIEVVELLK